MTISKKLLPSFILMTLALSVGLSSGKHTVTQAKASVKVVWRQKMTHGTYTINPSKANHAYAYSAKLGKKLFKLSNYTNRTFTTYYHQKLKINNKSRIYYYVKSATKKSIAGWVWRGYLTKKNSNSKSSTSIIGATVNSQSQLMSYVNDAPDLDPSLTVLGFETNVYSRYKSLLSQQYNLGQFAAADVFKNNHAKIYVANSQLNSYVNTAIQRWNSALGKNVFSIGSASDHTLIIELSDNSEKDWDGLFSGNTIKINTTNFTDPNYASNNLTTSPALETKLTNISNQASSLLDLTNTLLNKLRINYQLQYLTLQGKYNSSNSSSTKSAIQKQISDLTSNYDTQNKAIRENYNAEVSQLQQAVKDAYNQEQPSISQASTENYWTTVIMHELGHSLGLYHTPYRSDVMYASSSSEQDATPSPVKYAWTQAKDPSDDRAYVSATLTSRDVDRAKLAGILGYW